jgi:hypothetical protein
MEEADILAGEARDRALRLSFKALERDEEPPVLVAKPAVLGTQMLDFGHEARDDAGRALPRCAMSAVLRFIGGGAI